MIILYFSNNSHDYFIHKVVSKQKIAFQLRNQVTAIGPHWTETAQNEPSIKLGGDAHNGTHTRQYSPLKKGVRSSEIPAFRSVPSAFLQRY